MFAKDEYYTKIYRKVFEFHKKYANPKNSADFTNIALEAKNFQEPLEKTLYSAVIDEIERIYKQEI